MHSRHCNHQRNRVFQTKYNPLNLQKINKLFFYQFSLSNEHFSRLDTRRDSRGQFGRGSSAKTARNLKRLWDQQIDRPTDTTQIKKAALLDDNLSYKVLK